MDARLQLPRMLVSRLLKSWAMPPARTPRLSSFWDWRRDSSATLRSVMSARMATNCTGLPSGPEEGHDGGVHPVEGPVLGPVRISPFQTRPARMVPQRLAKKDLGWCRLLMIRWSWPSSSSRAYLEMAQNLSFT